MAYPIDIEDLTVRYKDRTALDSLTLKVEAGAIFGFIGPNGAGKTTAIKALLGLVPPSRGRALLGGYPAADIRARRFVGYLPEETSYYRFLTPAEILAFYGKIFGLGGELLRRRVEELLALVGLAPHARRLVKTLSKGTVQKIGLAQALVNDPDILILDEPTSGLDPLARLDLRTVLLGLKQKGKTIFFSSHELSEVELICDSIAILKGGRLVRTGGLGEILRSAEGRSLERFFLETMREAG